MDFKLELGLARWNTLLADEIVLTPAGSGSPQQCRGSDLDKDRFRKDLGGVMEAYGEVLKRVQGMSQPPQLA